MKTDETEAVNLGKVDVVVKKWAGMHANKLAHFGCRSTNRVEGAHATLKTILVNAGGNLKTVYQSIDKWYMGMVRRLTRKYKTGRCQGC
jgi:hypothetical protein